MMGQGLKGEAHHAPGLPPQVVEKNKKGLTAAAWVSPKIAILIEHNEKVDYIITRGADRVNRVIEWGYLP